MFEIIDPITATLSSVTNRTEMHGDDAVPAISLGLKIESANTILDLLSKSLRAALYCKPKGQKDLEGVESVTPNLRTDAIEHLAIVGCFEGWTLNVDHGIDEAAPIAFGSCKVDKFRLVAKEGGSVELALRVGTSDIDADRLGIVGMKLGQSIKVTLIAPKAGETKKATDGKPTLSPEAAWPFPKNEKTPEQALAESKAA